VSDKMMANLNPGSIAHSNSQFWEQMLDMKMEAAVSAEGFCLSAGHVEGTIKLYGAWSGLVEVRLSAGLAYEATAAMLMQAVENVVETDVLDAAKEIANMIAGVIKTSLPRPCSMAVPQSAIASERFCCPLATADTLAVAFHHASGSSMVRVREEQCRQSNAIPSSPDKGAILISTTFP
jgi:CheY-specific phosphatase CheX